MAITSYGYRGTIDEVQWARMAPHISAARYGVVGIDDCEVTAVAGADRTLRVASGRAWGLGVMDELDHNPEPLQVQLPPVASGSRWDLIVLRRSWLDTPGQTTVGSVQGTSSKVIPSGRQNTAGDVDEQPLALVRVVAGQSVPAEIIDLRCWASNGGVQVLDELALQYLAFPGSMVWHKWRSWAYTRDSHPGAPWGWHKIGDIGMLHGISGNSYSGWDWQGSVTSTQDPPRRITTLAARIRRTGGSVSLSSTTYDRIGVILPATAMAKTTPPTGHAWIHGVGVLTGAGSSRSMIDVALNVLTGEIDIAAQPDSITVAQGNAIHISLTWNVNS